MLIGTKLNSFAYPLDSISSGFFCLNKVFIVKYFTIMKYSFTIGQIKEAIDNGNKGVVSFKKNELSLREDAVKTGNTYANSIEGFDKLDPKTDVTAPVGNLTSSSEDDPIVLNVTSPNKQETIQKVKKLSTEVAGGKYGRPENVQIKASVSEGRNEIPFTKRELNEMLKG